MSFGFRFTITVVARYKCIKLYPVLQEFNLQCILNLVKIETFGAMNCRHNVTIELVFCLMHFLLFNLSFKSFKSRICQFSFWFNGNSKFQMTSCLGFRKYLMAESRKAPRIRYGYTESIFMFFFFTKVWVIYKRNHQIESPYYNKKPKAIIWSFFGKYQEIKGKMSSWHKK